MVVDEKTIAGNDVQTIIDPIWLSANIYGSYADYESSLTRFSKPQRLVHAMQWYDAEVSNGGHYQFYFNSTGIVWKDAETGFKEAGLPEVAKIIAESAKRMGGQPSFDRQDRINTLERLKPEFDDLDDRYYGAKRDLDTKLLTYIRSNSKEFLFEGDIETHR